MLTLRAFPFAKFTVLLCIFGFLLACQNKKFVRWPISKVTTLAGFNREFGEPFGVAVKDNVLYVSDGEQGKIFRLSMDGKVDVLTDKLNTPSQIVFDKNGDLIVADSGASTIKRIKPTGEIELVAGVENQHGFQDGDARSALFNAPIGIAVWENKIFVADTYNDKIRVIENGSVSTLAGSATGFAEGNGGQAKFDTPCGLAMMPTSEILVADAKNHRIRVVEQSGQVWTLSGDGKSDLKDGPFEATEFVQPSAITVDTEGSIYIADGNALRVIERKNFPAVTTISATKHGFGDGALQEGRFNRPSGLATDERGNVFIADSDNQAVRVLTGENIGSGISKDQVDKIRYTPEEFRTLQPARWTYNPPDAKRDVAGTLGEVRGEITDGKNAWFHNGLDIAGNYGETARFVRTDKVLQPIATDDFGGLRERLRMATLGYIHIRLGRDQNGKVFDDNRFQFSHDDAGKLNGVRVPRGTKFEAGDAIGTLNTFNHVHLIAGRSGSEMNALDALLFPNIADKIAPTIEKVYLTDERWKPLETKSPAQRISINGKTRVIVRAFDQMDGGAAYRRLGVYKLGYQILRENKSPLTETKWTISFEKMPDESFVPLVYAPGSKAGYTPETIFDYVITNEVNGDTGQEKFLDTDKLEKGNYILRVSAADFFGNATTRDVNFELSK